jgi:hypothetical protein
LLAILLIEDIIWEKKEMGENVIRVESSVPHALGQPKNRAHLSAQNSNNSTKIPNLAFSTSIVCGGK